MAKDVVRFEAGERVDLDDFTTVAESGLDQAGHLLESMLTNPSGQRMWVLDGFAITNPSASLVRVTKGRAILARREGGEILYGLLATEGDATKTVDIAAFSAGTYGIYIRFEFVDGEDASRIFWNAADDGSEYAQAIASRRTANWSLKVELTSPGVEWFKIGEVVQASMALTDQRKFYFEGDVSAGYVSGWGAGNDRNANRATYGVKDFQTFVAAVRQCMEEIKGTPWYEEPLQGLNDKVNSHLLLFGDGSDGNVTIAGTVTLTRPMYYDNLTIPAGANKLITAGWPVFVKNTLTLSGAPADAITVSGGAGGAGTNGSGGTAGVPANTSSSGAALGGGGAGAAAPNSGTGNNATGIRGNGGNGGSGGESGSPNAGGTGGTRTLAAMSFRRVATELICGAALLHGGQGGGSGGSANTLASGGGGGAGGAVLFLAAAKIVTNGSTAAGCISSKGGNGGAGFDATGTANSGGGGGGGGGGGWIYAYWQERSGAAVANAFNAAGGAGGAGGGGNITGGDGGSGGEGGRINTFNLWTLATTEAVGSAGSAGVANSGVAGGAGGAGGTCTATL